MVALALAACVGDERPANELGGSFRRAGSRYVAAGQAHRVSVDGAGFSIEALSERLRLATDGISRLGWQAAGAGAPMLDEHGVVVLARGRVAEQVRQREDGVEQSWLFETRPAGDGDLVVQVRVDGLPHAAETDSGLHFAAADGRGFCYGNGVWIDARGVRTPVRPTWRDGRIELRVAAEVVDSAAYPAVLDPAIGPEISIDVPVYGPSTENSQAMGAVATDGTDYLVVWTGSDSALSDTGLKAARIAQDGTVLDPTGFTIAPRSPLPASPEVAYDGTNYLVVWWTNLPPTQRVLHAARVTPTGTVLDPGGFVVATVAGWWSVRPSIAGGDGVSLVVWKGGGNVSAVRIDSGGVVLDPTPFSVFPDFYPIGSDPPRVAWDGSQFTVVWVSDDPGGYQRIKGARVDADGLVLDSSPFIVADVYTARNPAISWGADEYLVTYYTGLYGGPAEVYGQRLGTDGMPIGAPFLISDAAGRPAVGFDGTSYLVAWPVVDASIAAKRVDTTGAVLDATPLLIAAGPMPFDSDTRIACLTGQCMVTWRDERESPTYAYVDDIRAARVAGGVVLDPGGLVASAQASEQHVGAVASDGASYLVVWTDHRSGTADVYGQIVGSDGTLAAPAGFPIATTDLHEVVTTVAYGGGVYLVAWNVAATVFSSAEPAVYAARVTPAGVVLDPDGVPVVDEPWAAGNAAAASDGTDFLVVWADSRTGQADIFGSRVVVAGGTLDVLDSSGGFVVSLASGNQVAPAVDWTGGQYLVAWADGRMSGASIYGARVTTLAEVLDPFGLQISPSTVAQSSPTVAGNDGFALVAWSDGDGSVGSTDIAAARVSEAGVILDTGGISVADAAGGKLGASACREDEGFLVAWLDARSGSYSEIYAARVRADGTVVEPDGELVTAVESGPFTDADPPFVAGTDTTALVAYSRYDLDPVYFGTRARVRLISRLPLGEPCLTVADCRGGYCVDGVCCADACGDGDPGDCSVCGAGGICTLVAAGTTCRPTAGACDAPETCNGTAPACPADGFVASGTTCRVAAGLCDLGEACTGTSAACPVDVFADATLVCRTPAGVCDAAETCSGASAGCGPDLKRDGQVCRAAAGPCDLAEICAAGADVCPSDLLEPPGIECRPAAGPCDTTAQCTGGDPACPANVPRPAGTVCRAAGGLCDVEEVCNGVAFTCPSDVLVAAGSVCRDAAGPCDEIETCTGASTACPPDALRGTVVCRPSAGACDGAEVCTGTSPACPADALRPAGFECRPAAGGCDPAELCDGLSGTCPVDALHPSGYVCRSGVDTCDLEETCSGLTTVCPPDMLVAAGTVCRPIAGSCDVEEACTGVSAYCPADGFLSDQVDCRAAIGGCDQVESCTGVSATCPPDLLRPAGAMCRPLGDYCDVVELCSGMTAFCPSDAHAVDGTSCEEVSACVAGGTCAGGTCSGGTDVVLASPSPLVIAADTSRVVEITNMGDALVTLTGAAASPEEAFAIVGTPFWPRELDPGESAAIEVAYTPTAEPTIAGLLAVSAAGCPDQEVALVGVEELPDAGPPDAEVPDAEASDATSASDAATDAAGADAGAPPGTGGCDCRTGRGESGLGGALVGLVLVLALRPPRRRLRWARMTARVLVVAVLLAACGKREPAAAPEPQDAALAPYWHPGLSPVVGPEIYLDDPVYGPSYDTYEVEPAVAFDGTNYLVVWYSSYGIVGRRVTAAGEVLDVGGIVIRPYVWTGVGQGHPAVAFDGANYLVVWEEDYDLHAARVSPSGVVLDSTSILVSDAVGTERNPAVAFGGGMYLVVWGDERSGGFTYSARVTPEGEVLDPFGLAVGEGRADLWDGRPAVAWDGTNFTVVWRGRYSEGVLGARMATSGARLDILPFTIASGSMGLPSIAFGESEYLVVWGDWTATGAIHASRLSTAGSLVGGTIVVATEPGVNETTLGFDGTSYVVGWTPGYPRDVHTARVDLDGTLLDATPIVVVDAGEDQGELDLDCSTGSCLVVWEDTRSSVYIGWYADVRAARLTGGVVEDVDGFVVHTTASHEVQPAAATDGVSYFVAWADARAGDHLDILGQVVSAAGDTLLADPVVVGAGPGNQQEPAIAFGDGVYLVVWQGPSQVFGARVSSAGAALDPVPVQISTTSGAATLPAVASDGTDFLVVWTDSRAGGLDTDIYGARVESDLTVLDPTGLPIGVAVDPQVRPAIAYTGSQYVVAWQDERGFIGTDIYAARVTSAGAVLDPAGILVKDVSDAQLQVAVAGAGDQAFLVWWDRTDSMVDLWGDLRGARIDEFGTLLDPGGFLIAVAADSQDYPAVTFDGDAYVAAWRDARATTPGMDVYATRVSTDGVVHEPAGQRITDSGIFEPPGLAAIDGQVLVAYGRFDAAPEFSSYRARAKLIQRLPLGSPCEEPGDCRSAFCVDGVCCADSCGDGDPSDCRACAPVTGICGAAVAGTICRPGLGGCDPAETCDGAALICPANVLAPSGTVCRAAAGLCDSQEVCTGTGVACPADALRPAGATCRVAAGGCDATEVCSGTTIDCPTDQLRPAGAVCRVEAGPCDVAETCSGTTVGCPADAVLSATTVCGSPTGTCAAAATCDGSGTACPADPVLPSGTVCRAATGVCDAVETCTGAVPDCPPDALQPPTEVCRTPSGPCDASESCTGTNAACPGDALSPSGTTCRAAAGPCDFAEVCSGTADSCPPNLLAPPAVECRPAAGACDLAEECTGASALCPPDLVRAAGIECRAVAGDCDLAEACTGSSAACPTDSFRPAGVTCRAVFGICDVAEVCPGDSPACPPDGLRGMQEECRPAVDLCDRAETCTGTDIVCPADQLAPAGQVCRPRVDHCDLVDVCSGSSTACPPDGVAADGTPCPDVSACVIGGTCSGGACAGGVDVITATPSPLVIGLGVPHSVTVGNSGAADVNLVAASAAPPEEFAILDAPAWPSVLGPGDTVRLDVTFEPSSPAPVTSGVLRIGATDCPDISIPLVGENVVLPDAGPDAEAPDAAPPVDGALPEDAAAGVDADFVPPSGGCGCRTSQTDPQSFAPLLLLLLLVPIRWSVASRPGLGRRKRSHARTRG